MAMAIFDLFFVIFLVLTRAIANQAVFPCRISIILVLFLVIPS